MEAWASAPGAPSGALRPNEAPGSALFLPSDGSRISPWMQHRRDGVGCRHGTLLGRCTATAPISAASVAHTPPKPATADSAAFRPPVELAGPVRHQDHPVSSFRHIRPGVKSGHQSLVPYFQRRPVCRCRRLYQPRRGGRGVPALRAHLPRALRRPSRRFRLELWNEMNAVETPEEFLRAWNVRMLPRVKEIFPKTR